MLKLLLRHRIKVALALLLGVAAVAGVLVWGVPFGLDEVMRAKDAILAWLEGTHPALMVCAIGFLPLIGFPVSPMLILAGIAYGGVVGLAVGVGGIALNNALGFGIAAWLREPVRAWLEKRGVRVPEVEPRDFVKVVLLFRIVPGFPATFQNYILGLTRIPFFTYFWVSLIPQVIVVAGFVLTGGALFEGRWGVVLLGVSLLLVFGIVGRLMQEHRKKNTLNNGAGPDNTSR
ncbi:MAG: TVP38/TMEM64 family protein [Puniceicoccales bacterium]